MVESCADVLKQGIKVLRSSRGYPAVNCSVQPQERNDILEVAFYFCGQSDVLALVNQVLYVLCGIQ